MAKKKRLNEQPCEVAKIDTEVAKDRVFSLIEECTELYMKLVSLYEDLGGNGGEFYEEISMFDDSDLPVTDEEVAAIQNEMKKRS